MAVIDAQGNSGRIILVRNHEGAAGTPYLDKRSITYRNDAAGGTTNLIFSLRHGAGRRTGRRSPARTATVPAA